MVKVFDVNTWLSTNINGFAHIDEAVKLEILNFTLLWSLFESENFKNKSANITKIKELVDKKIKLDDCNLSELNCCFLYFKNRLILNGDANVHFNEFKFLEADKSYVKNILCSNDVAFIDMAKILLILVYRLRNNLFHGTKWRYGLSNQFENFRNANIVLMTLILHFR